MIDPADLDPKGISSADAIELAALISTTHLHGRPAVLVAAALAELLSRLLINYKCSTAELLLTRHIEMVRELTEANRALLPKDWRNKRYGHIP